MAKSSSLFLSLFLFCFLLLTACSPKILRLQDTVPTVGFRGIKIENFQPGNNPQDIKMRMGLKFLFTNPFSKSLTIPEHQITLKLNDKKLNNQLEAHPSFNIPPNGQKMEIYMFTLDLNPQGYFKNWNVLGRDNYFEFESRIKIDLSDFAQELGKYGIALPENELTEKLNVEEILKQKLGEHTIEFAFGDTIRLPVLPGIALSSQPGKVNFLGSMDTVDLSIFQDAITPFIDNLLNAKLQSDMISPFIRKISEIDCPNIPQPRPCIDMFDDAVRGFIDLSFNGTQETNLRNDWNNLMEDLTETPEKEDPVIDLVVQTFLPNAQPNLNLLNSQWDAFKAFDPLIIFPGKNVYGIEVILPFKFINNNKFPIEAPHLLTETSINLPNGQTYVPVTFDAAPTTNSTTIPAEGSKEMRMKMRLTWDQGGNGVMAFISGQTLSPNLTGKSAIDVGYGPLKFNFNLANMQFRVGE